MDENLQKMRESITLAKESTKSEIRTELDRIHQLIGDCASNQKYFASDFESVIEDIKDLRCRVVDILNKLNNI